MHATVSLLPRYRSRRDGFSDSAAQQRISFVKVEWR
jgi:hypothetical protein